MAAGAQAVTAELDEVMDLAVAGKELLACRVDLNRCIHRRRVGWCETSARLLRQRRLWQCAAWSSARHERHCACRGRNQHRYPQARPRRRSNQRARRPSRRHMSATLGGFLGLCAVLLLAPGRSVAESAPHPPCASPPSPAYAEVGSLPAVRVWAGTDLGPDWVPAACTGWRPLAFRTLVAAAGRFRFSGLAEDLLARFAAVTALTTIRYWSVSDQRWENLVTSASALSGSDASTHRPDFRVNEMTAGAALYFVQNDNRSTNDVVYRLRVQEFGPDRLMIETENVSSVRYLLLPLAGPGDLQALYFLERQTSNKWGYYSLARTSASTSLLIGGHEASYINRAVALFRYIAGLPTDQEPPAAP
jgi:hypothetical protein